MIYSTGPYYWPWYVDCLGERNLRLVTPPPVDGEPITLAVARQHLRLDTYGSPPSHPDDDLLQTVYIPAAREACEVISGRAFAPQTFELSLRSFPWPSVAYGRNGIALGMGPIAGIDTFGYYDGDDVAQILASSEYVLDPYRDGGYVYPVNGGSWPSAQVKPNGVTIRFTAGFDAANGSPADRPLPSRYKQAMLLMLGHLYENREDTTTLKLESIPMGVRALLGPDSLVNGFA